MTRWIAVVLALSVFVVGAQATELRAPTPVPQESSLVRQGADAAIGRPVAALRLAVGVVAFPLSLAVGTVLLDPLWAWEACIEKPWEALVRNPLTAP